MNRLIAATAALTLLAIPTSALAKPSESDRTNAAQECRAERGDSATMREAFRAKYGTNANGRNAFGKCVSTRARAEEQQVGTAHANASKQCKVEAEQLGPEAFAAKYGSGKKGRNAHGKCVSGKAKELKAAADAKDRDAITERKNAAKTCAAEREEIGAAAFAAKYGTNKNKRNAFGKCVSQTAKAQHDQPAPTS
jgi:hypothetical protein